MHQQRTVILAGFILAKFVLQYFAISADYDLQRDEFLHLDQANHLAWGYLSVPPVTSWISWLIKLLGNSVFWIKFFPALFGALTMVLVWKTIGELKGTLFAHILGATGILFSALLRLNTLYQPNSLDVLSWTAFYFTLVKFISNKQPRWLYAGALVFAIGFLNKYNIVFLALGLLPAILLTKHRSIFLQPHFYFAALLALLLVSPNLWWQYRNNFPVFHHLQELAETQLVHVNRLDFLKEQLLYFIGEIFVLFAGVYAILFYAPFKPFRVFFWSILFTLAVFIYFKAKGYYAIGVYPIYIAFGAVFLGEKLQRGWIKYLQPVTLALPVLLFIPMFNVFFPNKSPDYIASHSKPYKSLNLLRWEDGKDHALPQDFADMLGWKELAEKLDSVVSTLPNLDHTIILCDNYGQAGAINYYSRNKQVKASSFDADYINWLPLQQKITSAILVKGGDDEDKDRKEEIPLFDTVYLATKRINAYAREPEISIYVLRGAKVDINQRITAEMESEKIK
jgi:hypothetical protein